MKFKVGDNVKIVQITEGSQSDLLDLIGTTHKVTSIHPHSDFQYRLDDISIYKEWKEIELELCSPTTQLDFLLSLIK